MDPRARGDSLATEGWGDVPRARGDGAAGPLLGARATVPRPRASPLRHPPPPSAAGGVPRARGDGAARPLLGAWATVPRPGASLLRPSGWLRARRATVRSRRGARRGRQSCDCGLTFGGRAESGPVPKLGTLHPGADPACAWPGRTSPRHPRVPNSPFPSGDRRGVQCLWTLSGRPQKPAGASERPRGFFLSVKPPDRVNFGSER